MDSDAKFWISFWSLICSSIVLVLLVFMYYCDACDERMLKAGYKYQHIPTVTRTSGVWVAPAEATNE